MAHRDLPTLARMIDDAMTQRGWSPRDVEAASRQHDPRERGINHGTVTDLRSGRWGPRGPAPRTLRLVAQTLGLDHDTVIKAANEPTLPPRALPDDFHYLTPTQWNVLQETAHQFRLANEREPLDDIDTGASSGVKLASTDS